MTEYWKSIPKKYCDICKVWYQDNKISVENHEKGFSHQANVRRRLGEIRKESAARAKEKASHDAEIQRIEAAAMKSFQSDIAADPSKAKDIPLVQSISGGNESKSNSRPSQNKFGETSGTESINLQKSRGKALETIASKMQKKSKWLEAKTAEGNTYYWNRETCDTVWEPPKHGFLSLEEQESTGFNLSLPSPSSAPKMTPYGRWKEVVEETPFTDETVDLQLPSSNHHLVEEGRERDVIYVEPDEGKEEGLFEEKSVDVKSNSRKVEFKKRPIKSQFNRQVRKRESSP